MKRLTAGMTAALLAVILVFSVPGEAVSAKSAILMDPVTGNVLYERNSDARSLIASTTKIMTALVVCEQCNVLDRMRVPKEAIGIEGSSMYLRDGEILTVQELLYGLMLHSGNDAAVALAIYCGGTVEGFVALMNDKANALGLNNTHFENPHGLDGNRHFSTARDLAVLSAYAMENPIFAKTVSTKIVTIGNRHLRNHNKLLWLVDGADGIKTGYTRKAGRILVSSACRDGRRLVSVTIDDPDDWNDHAALLNMGFSKYDDYVLVEKGMVVASVELVGATENSVHLIAKEGFSYPLGEYDDPQIYVVNPGFVYAPVVQGQDAGFAYVYLADKCVGKIPLMYGQTLEMAANDNRSFFGRIFGGIN